MLLNTISKYFKYKPVGDRFARCLTICDIGVSLHLFAYVDISK